MVVESLSKNVKRDLIRQVTAEPGKKVSLSKGFSTKFKFPDLTKGDARNILDEGVALLAEEQAKLYAQDAYAVLVIFQALDAAGKDGTIKHVMSGLNPQGCRVYSFKAPSAEELDHDYLWRCTKSLPERGCLGIFNRSYYEEVLVARVHPEILARQKLPEAVRKGNIWQKRFDQINHFEQYLVENGIVVVKFFLHISKEEQKQRFLERIEIPEKNWKFELGDVRERQFWDQYMKAYEDCFTHTSTAWAPWHIIPADHKPSARLLVALVLYETLRGLKLHYPSVGREHLLELKKAKAALLSED